MAQPKSQYHHYIPRFILKQFTFDTFENFDKSGKKQENFLLHVMSPDHQFQVEDVSKTCGKIDLYMNSHETDPMRVEKLFSDLESRASSILAKIREAVSQNLDTIEIFQSHVTILFKFMYISIVRVLNLADQFKNPLRENDFAFQHEFETAEKDGLSTDPHQVWLRKLVYILERSHEELLNDSKEDDPRKEAQSYAFFFEKFALQIWRAAHGHEFFLNERFVDFEGDTQSRLCVESKETGPELVYMTTEDPIHIVLPISPEVAVVFCNEARCWYSPVAEIMHEAGISFPENSLLHDAPHKDIIMKDVPKHKKGKKSWPATTMWRVGIGRLTEKHQRVISSYSLGHARSFVIVRRRSRLERAKKDFQVFNKEKIDYWKRTGFRLENLPEDIGSRGLRTLSNVEKIAGHCWNDLKELLTIIIPSTQPLQRDKANTFKCWNTFRAIQALQYGKNNPPPESEVIFKSTVTEVIRGFESAYPPKPTSHRSLISIDFAYFITNAMGESTFTRLLADIDGKILESIVTDYLERDSIAFKSLETSLQYIVRGIKLESIPQSPNFILAYKAAASFETLKWMFEERQDILATFIQKLSVPLESTQPKVIRIRARRE
ncbi:hypothetical protein F4811DRAFT_549158 [Daldinia bambusicola]|nr:hypothetical protein F4811DRAFT_549158 [Daldinia bambusicola]